MGYPARNIADRFWEKVNKSGGPDACWPWTAARDSNGYGKFFAGIKDGKKILAKANRVAWELVHGPIPDGLCSLHHCDNPACCNSVSSRHLFIGTRIDNQRDMVSKGRNHNGDSRGSSNGRAVLTEADIIEIRRLYSSGESQVSISSRYGVAHQMVSRIVRCEAWRHV